MNGFEEIDPGHLYKLDSIDGSCNQELRFVKREGEKYPGNIGAFPGATLQMVVRVLISRTKYLQGQIWCLENSMIMLLLKTVLWLLEHRAAHRHKLRYIHGLNFATYHPMCKKCGHTVCQEAVTK